jgi:hypothetical protein
MPFEAPAQVPNTFAQRTCAERRRFNYRNPCSNLNNYIPGFTITNQNAAQRYSLTPDGGNFDGEHRRCTETHRNRHSMCRYCIAAAEDQPWFRRAYDFIAQNNPTPATESNVSSHFLTRMCRLCEYREEVLLAQLGSSAPGAPAPPPGLVPPQHHPTQDELDWVSDWPTNRCTCEKKGLYTGIMCLPHRKRHWEKSKRQLVYRMKRNRQYLMNTERVNGARVNLTVPTALRRAHQNLYRACRCGEVRK